MFRNKSREFLSEVEHLIDICNKGMEAFKAAISYFIKNGIDGEYLFLASELKRYESLADSQVFLIKELLYRNFLLPEAREDIAVLLNALDDIIDAAEDTIKFISTRQLKPLKQLEEPLLQMTFSTGACFNAVEKSLYNTFKNGDKSDLIHIIEDVGSLESQCDSIEEQLLTSIYKLELPGIQAILLSTFIENFAKISDACEEVGNIVSIVNMKRII